MTQYRRLPQWFLNAALVALLAMLLYPLGFTLWGAFKSDVAFAATRWYPTLPLRVGNVSSAFGSIWRYLLNTVFVAGVGTAGMLLIASLSAFTFARMKFFAKEWLYMLVLALMMIPGALTLVPGYMLYKTFDLLNSYWALILPLVTGGPIFGIFLLRSFFESIPKDYFEAAQMDGAHDFKLYYRIALPLCIPIMGTLAIMQIVGAWNEYLWPMITIADHEKLTIAAGLLISFTGQYTSNMPVTFGGYLVASVPLILLFTFTNRYYVQGLLSTAIKL
ncbi:carbohydrate ABC transporter permease [Cohnella nanjingensis]|uniref:Carbohydrate ABC transporter permease n=1 Tax=Cohnella nanjingensis TaxID=1387779 RepID=A0A7X0RPD0_9BACL|nr:carbohydrate ABC transporter permease [Cohnella nanjingensis]MBB6671247.1 carbohydrate ABC transporter permease [Cohnella nanjingensis]